MNAATRTPDPRLSRINASIMPRGAAVPRPASPTRLHPRRQPIRSDAKAGAQHDRPGPVCCHDCIIGYKRIDSSPAWDSGSAAGARRVADQIAVLLVHSFQRRWRRKLRRLP
jgi:hypothetical protein